MEIDLKHDFKGKNIMTLDNVAFLTDKSKDPCNLNGMRDNRYDACIMLLMAAKDYTIAHILGFSCIRSHLNQVSCFKAFNPPA